MKEVFLKRKRVFLILLIPYILLILLSVIPTNNTTIGPGEINSVQNFIDFEYQTDLNNKYYTTSVFSFDNATPLMVLLSRLNKDVTLSRMSTYYQDTKILDRYAMGYLMKEDSINKAILNASNYLSLEYTSIEKNIVYLTYNYLTNDNLKIGDEITSVNGSTDIYNAIEIAPCYTESTFVVIDEDSNEKTLILEKREHNDHCSFGIYVDSITKITTHEYDYDISNNAVMGPSGGLLQTLYLIDLLGADFLDNDLLIGGTGTIDILGNIGAIGGVKQKIITASKNNIDVFFVPHLSDEQDDNYIEALLTYNQLDTEMVLVGVSTLQEALDYLMGVN